MNQLERLTSVHPQALKRAVEVLQAHGLIVFPTDTLYGLACLPHSDEALAKVYAAKHRSHTKALPVLIANRQQLAELVSEIPECAEKLMDQFWPGKLTLILPKQESLPVLLSPFAGIAIRMPNHPFALSLLQKTGPLAVTSANLSEHANHAAPAEIVEELEPHLNLIIEDGILSSTTASTIVDCTQKPPIIIRQGVIPETEIISIIGQ